MHRPYVQEAEIEIDPAQFEVFKAAITTQIRTAVRDEPAPGPLRRLRSQRSRTGQSFRNLPGLRRVQVSSGDSAFQALQGDDSEDGQSAQATPDHADHAWCKAKMSRT
jgi:hypothetical protein